MALPSTLSEKGLAKFRTKLCERILASGSCSFGAKCQYAHVTPPRRNPKKIFYRPICCPDLVSCPHGGQCEYAHTADEELYHPSTYKTILCLGRGACSGFYCPFVHSGEELGKVRDAAISSATGDNHAASSKPTMALHRVVLPNGLHGALAVPVGRAPLPAPGLESLVRTLLPPPPLPEDREFWWVGDQHELRVFSQEEVTAFEGDGDALVGGVLRPGMYSAKDGKDVKDVKSRVPSPEIPCIVKLVAINRSDSQFATQVVKESRKWIAHCGGNGCVLALRRTVATTVLALPDWLSPLSRSIDALGRPLAEFITEQWSLLFPVAEWVGQLLHDVQSLHMEVDGIAHLCLGPQTVLVDQHGQLRIGDFLGKVKALRMLASNSQGKKEEAKCADVKEWAMWYPAEVHRRVNLTEDAYGSEDNAKLDLLRVDSWQFGICVFYLLTGRHLFGDARDPDTVLANIAADHQVNRKCLEGLPLFLDLVTRLTARCPEQRLSLRDASKHPLFWSFSEAVRLSSPMLPAKAAMSRGRPLPSNWLGHIPAVAPLCVAVPSSPPVEFFARIRSEAEASSWVSSGVSSFLGSKVRVDNGSMPVSRPRPPIAATTASVGAPGMTDGAGSRAGGRRASEAGLCMGAPPGLSVCAQAVQAVKPGTDGLWSGLAAPPGLTASNWSACPAPLRGWVPTPAIAGQGRGTARAVAVGTDGPHARCAVPAWGPFSDGGRVSFLYDNCNLERTCKEVPRAIPGVATQETDLCWLPMDLVRAIAASPCG